MSVRCTSRERYGSGMSSGAIARTCGRSTPDRAYTKSSGKSIPADGVPRLRVPDAGMFRLEKPWKERVDAQKTIATERHDVAGRLVEEAVGVERAQRFVEAVQDVDAVLLGKIPRANAAELQLQHELADETLFRVGSVRTAQRKNAIPNLRAVGLPFVEVLHVHAVDVAERRDAETGQIGALPQTIAIDERGALGVSHGRVRAADRVTRLLQRLEGFINPAALCRPACDVLLETSGTFQHVAADCRVE